MNEKSFERPVKSIIASKQDILNLFEYWAASILRYELDKKLFNRALDEMNELSKIIKIKSKSLNKIKHVSDFSKPGTGMFFFTDDNVRVPMEEVLKIYGYDEIHSIIDKLELILKKDHKIIKIIWDKIL